MDAPYRLPSRLIASMTTKVSTATRLSSDRSIFRRSLSSTERTLEPPVLLYHTYSSHIRPHSGKDTVNRAGTSSSPLSQMSDEGGLMLLQYSLQRLYGARNAEGVNGGDERLILVRKLYPLNPLYKLIFSRRTSVYCPERRATVKRQTAILTRV